MPVSLDGPVNTRFRMPSSPPAEFVKILLAVITVSCGCARHQMNPSPAVAGSNAEFKEVSTGECAEPEGSPYLVDSLGDLGAALLKGISARRDLGRLRVVTFFNSSVAEPQAVALTKADENDQWFAVALQVTRDSYARYLDATSRRDWKG